ncbi:SGNH/GDSL hydrolase family protein [Paenibacillus sp. J5C_2022]|uniref:SGNH/GDSL hydrolase family protein n=1 Tax=Paenibacillus sp. J5C2022 TaxID=2977129 RepID=UPI0021CF1EB8|nr:SGNH/GDSL hydrolase family protein [Paenibacillus sp. J5C2022]MCU6711331.1 SGNH/GDSL hydrolase family protein [Paenibacillus sp. J5C2022]
MLIAGYGDSITAGVHMNRGEGYIEQLASLLGGTSVNAGVSGQTTEDAWPRLERDVLSQKPDICVVQFGMNDHVAVARGQSRVALSLFRDNLIRIVTELKKRQIRSLLCTIHPIIEGNDEAYYYARHPREWYAPSGAGSWIERYSEAIRQAAAECGCALADVERHWMEQLGRGVLPGELLRTKENSGDDDGVHPTPLGHRLYAECMASQLID